MDRLDAGCWVLEVFVVNGRIDGFLVWYGLGWGMKSW